METLQGIDFRTSQDAAARDLMELVSEALRCITPAELAGLVMDHVAGNGALTATQKLGIRLMVRELAAGQAGSDLANDVLRACLYGSFEVLGAGEAEPLSPGQREGMLVLVGTICKNVVGSRAAQLEELAGRTVAVPSGWAG